MPEEAPVRGKIVLDQVDDAVVVSVVPDRFRTRVPTEMRSFALPSQAAALRDYLQTKVAAWFAV